MTLKFTADFSWRYGVVGVYKDRGKPIVRLYLPFARLSVEKV